ncbi:helix-turn-helix transcriptional regulator [Devriesea agamarum]|uniref:helix-turn-helix transcriptional regulator n=1 Tax=Devriesea agamarum TaxID=472569 RepID=UPI0009FF3530
MTVDAALGNIPQITKAVRLRLAREHAGLEQAELAERIGASRRTIGSAERGERDPRRTLVMAWALATGVPLQWIETGRVPSPDGDGTHMLPRLDSNQQPFD